MTLSDSYRLWLKDPELIEDQDLKIEFQKIYSMTKENLAIHIETNSLYSVQEETNVSLKTELLYIKELVDFLLEHFVPWALTQSEEYFEKANEMKNYLRGNPPILEKLYFQGNIGKQRLEIINYWRNHLE